MNHKKPVTILAILLVFLSPNIWAFGAKESTEDERKGAAAVVNGQIIAETAIQQELETVKKQYAASGAEFPAEQEIEIWRKILDNKVTVAVLVQEARKNKITITDEELNSDYSQVRDQFDTEEEYQAKLTEWGLSDARLKKEIFNSKMIEKLIESEVTSKISVSDDEVRAFYDDNSAYFKQPEQVNASHILVKVEKDADEAAVTEARTKIEGFKTRIDGGESFSEIAKANSDCPSSERGGNLGSFSRGQMVKPFEEAAFSLPIGTVSDPVRTDFGFHLIRVEEKTPEGVTEFDEVKEMIKSRMTENKSQQSIETYVTDLKDSSSISYPNGLPEVPEPEVPETIPTES